MKTVSFLHTSNPIICNMCYSSQSFEIFRVPLGSRSHWSGARAKIFGSYGKIEKLTSYFIIKFIIRAQSAFSL